MKNTSSATNTRLVAGLNYKSGKTRPVLGFKP